jgi:hypothetical protein
MQADSKTNFTPAVYPFTAAVIIFAAALLIPSASFVALHPELAAAIILDLSITAPVLYFFAIRKTGIPNTTVAPVAFLGLMTAHWILPPEQRSLSSLAIQWILPLIEIGVVAIVILKIRKSMQSYRSLNRENLNFRETAFEISLDLLGNKMLAGFVAFELNVIYHALFVWRRPNQKINTFTYHKNRGTVALYSVLIFLTFAETAVFHMIVALWSTIAAWILTALSLYFILLLWAQLKACFLRPIEILDGKLLIRSGLCCDAEIPIDSIEAIEFNTDMKQEAVLHASLLKGFENTNVLLKLSRPAIALGIAGFKHEFDRISLFVDDKERFRDRIESNDA